MCDQVSDHIDRLEAENAALRLLCDNQRKALEDIFEARHKARWWSIRELLDLLDAIESASSMTGTDESGGQTGGLVPDLPL